MSYEITNNNVEQIFSNLVNENVIFQNHGIHEGVFFLKRKTTDNGFGYAKILTMLIILRTVFIKIMKYNVFTPLTNLYRKNTAI